MLLLVGLATTSCSSFGAGRLVSSHMAYNDAVQLSVTREVLANIVRSRYADPMQFLLVSAVNAQFSVSAQGAVGVTGIGQSGATGDVGGTAGYTASPTITYIPQSDAAFYKSFYSPFEVEESLGFGLAYRFARRPPGWQTMNLRLSFAAINGASDFVGGQWSPLYNRRIDAMVRLLQLGASFETIAEWDADTIAIPKRSLWAEDVVSAFESGLNFVEEDGGENVRLARHRLVTALDLADPDDPQVVEALEALGVNPGRSQYVLRPPMDAEPNNPDPYAIWITPRSMADTISLAARFVEVPSAHGQMVPTIEPWREASSEIPLVRIRSAKDRPPFPYRVQHRGYWFYVDDADIDSKILLEFMVAAYSSRVGSKEAGADAPQVVVPVGGG